MKPLWNRIFYGACIGVIILCWAGIWIRFDRSNSVERTIASLDQVWQTKHKPKVLILFSLSDCGLCLQEAEFWSKAEFISKGHLLWDETDGVFRCVGSATNCDF